MTAYRSLLVLAAIGAMLALTPLMASLSQRQTLTGPWRRVCRAFPALALTGYLVVNLYLTLLSRRAGTCDLVTVSLLEPFRRALQAESPYAGLMRHIGIEMPRGFSFVPLEGLLLNLLLYVPLGYLLKAARPAMKGWQVLAAGAALSVVTEGVQLLAHMGWCDVNDLVYNVLGTLIGLGLWTGQKRLGCFAPRKPETE